MRKDPPNQYRYKGPPPLGTDDSLGMNGYFEIRLPSNTHKLIAECIVCDGEHPDAEGWEHVSVKIRQNGTTRVPVWNEMCLVKELFWEQEECVLQFHPAKSAYVNHHPHVLHLWRHRSVKFPVPNPTFVGPKKI